MQVEPDHYHAITGSGRRKNDVFALKFYVKRFIIVLLLICVTLNYRYTVQRIGGQGDSFVQCRLREVLVCFNINIMLFFQYYHSGGLLLEDFGHS